MPRPGFENVDDYIAVQPEPVRPMLERVRGAIRKALPKAEESISYQIPTYKIDGAPVIYFAGFKQHYSVYPANVELVQKFREELAPYEVNNKGTIRFPFTSPVPVKLIAAIAKFRAEQTVAYLAARAAAKKAKKVSKAGA